MRSAIQGGWQLIDTLNTIEQIEANLALKKAFKSKFDKYNGIVMYHYNVFSMKNKTQGNQAVNQVKFVSPTTEHDN